MFVWILLDQVDEIEGGLIDEIFETKEKAFTRLSELSKNFNSRQGIRNSIVDNEMIDEDGDIIYSIEKHEVS